MDWGKAKNILIIAFIITNVFLIYNIEKDLFMESAASMVKEKNIKDVITILDEKNIKVEAEVPRTILELPLLNVEYETYDQKKLKEKFYVEDNHKIIKYENYDKKPYMKDLNEKEALREAENFITKYGFMRNDAIYWETKEDGEQYHILFKQKYKKSFLENSYMRVTVSTSGVNKFERMWLKPLNTDKNKKEIIPATKALLKSMKDMENLQGEIVIKNMDLGYWFDPSYISLTNSENIKSGTAVPAWRILLNDGQTIFISAYENY
ncbi:two-component system regulatory protein YycI [Crassaminicella profunda]|uniref:two-component system regulatory protein YycI n=1 Tax=Crassaminicella profunda TaxID=1286698 RepID=UPI001CA60413|nr:two-component system regulatory protein YycI [Crassaminicella profunda]QZY55150.1 two-component system regulatory protein YycI [Crassaminicella profunda]